MLRIQKVLYPTDFSEHAEQALPLAVWLAEEQEAELHALHVLVLHAADEATLEAHLSELGEEARQALEALGNRAAGRSLRLVPVVRRGISAAPVILDYASEVEADLIVMGSHGRRGLRRLLLGSIAEEVVRLAHAPVLTVRNLDGSPTEPPEIRRVLAPVDFSVHSRHAAVSALGVARSFGASLQLLHVVETPLYPDVYYPVTAPALDLAEMRQTAQVRLEELAEELRGLPPGGEPVAIGVEVRVGRGTAEIVEYAEEVEADLIVIASHGLSGVERLLLGSVTEGVIRRAPCSVLTVKPFGKRIVVEADAAP